MSRQNLCEILVWAAGTAVIGATMLSASLVNSEDVPGAPIAPSVTIDGFAVSATVTPDPERHTVTIVFRTEPAIPGKAATVRVPAGLELRQFTGNPASRVMNPNDFKTTPVDETTIVLKTDGKKPAEARWSVAIPKPEGLDFMTTYQIVVRQGQDKVKLNAFSPALVWPMTPQVIGRSVTPAPVNAPVNR